MEIIAVAGIDDRGDPAGQQASESDGSLPTERRQLSPGLMNAVWLILIGVTLGVFWREVFQLTIRAIEAVR